MYESLGLIGIQLPEKYKRTSTIRAKALRLVLIRPYSKSSLTLNEWSFS